jgi:hypothetical protein
MVSCWIIDNISNIINIFADAVTSELEKSFNYYYFFHFFIKNNFSHLVFCMKQGVFCDFFCCLIYWLCHSDEEISHPSKDLIYKFGLDWEPTNLSVLKRPICTLSAVVSFESNCFNSHNFVINCHKKGQNGPKATNTLSTPRGRRSYDSLTEELPLS